MNTPPTHAQFYALEKKVSTLETDNKYLSDTLELMRHQFSILESNFYKLSEHLLEKKQFYSEIDSDSVGSYSNMPSLEYNGKPVDTSCHEQEEDEQEKDEQEKDEQEEDDEESQMIDLLNKVSEHIDSEWIDQALQKVQTQMNVVERNNSTRKERIRCSQNFAAMNNISIYIYFLILLVLF